MFFVFANAAATICNHVFGVDVDDVVVGVDVDDVVVGDTTASFLLVQPARCASNHFPVTHVVLGF